MEHGLSLDVTQSMGSIDASIFDGVNFEHMIGNANSQLLPSGMYQHPASMQGTEGLTEMSQATSMSHGVPQLIDVNMHQRQASQHQTQQQEQLQQQEAQQQQHQQ